MSETRHKGIIAYGTETDRLKVSALAKLAGLSVSEYIVNNIRRSYSEILGDTNPAEVIKR